MICTDEKLIPQGSDYGEHSSYLSNYEKTLSFNHSFQSSHSYDVNKIRFATIISTKINNSIIPGKRTII